MPSATPIKFSATGIKRKSGPGNTPLHKEFKKVKINATRPPKTVAKSTLSKNTRVEQDSTSSDSDDSDEAGGVALGSGLSGDGSDAEDLPEGKESLHPERANALVANSQTSKENHAEQKALAQKRKAAKPLADPLDRTKKLWERLRRKSHVPLEERKALIAELFEIITGRIKEFVLKHDSVRVVQTAIKYANLEQKRMIAKELAGSYRQLAESRYAKFLIGKLLVQGDDEIRDIIVPEFFGYVRKLIKHPEASWILDDVYRGVATKQQKAIILREWYGPEFSLFQEANSGQVPAELSEILAAEPGKRAPIMRSLLELINHLIQKKMTGFTLLHDAMLQYFLCLKPGTDEITEFLELLKGDEEGDLFKNLAFTKSGSRVVCLALAYGTAKDRKHILRMYKDTLQLMAGDANAHITILTAYEVIDDTVLTAKTIFPELLSKDADKQVENVVLSANDLNARTTLLYLFQGRSKALFPSNLSSDIELLEEVDTARVSTSKKNADLRQSELAKSLSPYLLKAIPAAAADLVATSFGCQFITEVLFGADGDKSDALAAIATTAAGDPSFIQPSDSDDTENQDAPPPHVGATPSGGKMLKSLIAGGRYDSKSKAVVPVSPALGFADILYPHIKEYIMEWATGSSSFVVLALLESDGFSAKDEVLKILRKNKTKLSKAATEETAEQKVKSTLQLEKDAKTTSKGKRGKATKPREAGNKGAALLLKML